MLEPEQNWSRREFVRALGAAGFITAFPAFGGGARPSALDVITVSILHTTDLHGHILPTIGYDGTPDVGGLARCVTQIRRWRRRNPNTILIDVGDVYQGTDTGLRTRGALMIDLFNHLKVDAWVVGNHEFDWGIDPFVAAVQRSRMPVLAANMTINGTPAGELNDARHPFSRVRPYLLKEVGGIRIAVIGITTPGMRFWFRPDFTRDLDFLYPVEPVRRAIVQARADGANAIVLAGHMGLKQRGGDDFANTLVSLTTEFPEVAVVLAGHTHQLVPRRLLNGVLVTQADHFGIHVGRVDLQFDRDSKRLIGRHAICERMDHRIKPAQVVLSRARYQLTESAAVLAEPVGELVETLHCRTVPAQPSDIESLIGAAIAEALAERGTKVDGVFHGLFDGTRDLPAGPKTIQDVWNILPYENFLVTAALTGEQLRDVLEETYATHENRSLLGFEVRTEGLGVNRKIISITPHNPPASDQRDRFRIAFNTFDSRSAGHKFMKLRAYVEARESGCEFHDVQTRDALIDYFRRHRVVSKALWQRPMGVAAQAA